MSRKVYFDAEVEILVPVRLKGEFMIRADEDDDVNFHEIIKRWSQQRLHPRGEVEASGDQFTITKIGAETIAPGTGLDDLGEAIEEQARAGLETVKFNMIFAKVVDSKLA